MSKKKDDEVEKQYFTVKVESLVPATAIYQILAESPEEAILLLKYKQPKDILYGFGKRKEKRIQVMNYGTTLIRLIKNLFL